MEELMEGFTSVSFNFGGFGSLVSIAGYVFAALALYTMAQRRGIAKAWLAWVPVLNVWILGSLSDQYRYVVKGEVKSKRKVLLVLSIASWILSLVVTIRFFALMISAIVALGGSFQEDQLFRMLANSLLSSLLWAIPGMVIGLVKLVFEIMALYDVYTSCDPANNTLYLILSIIPGLNQVTRPLFLFLCKDKDSGMPPRRENTVEF